MNIKFEHGDKALFHGWYDTPVEIGMYRQVNTVGQSYYLAKPMKPTRRLPVTGRWVRSDSLDRV